MAEDQEDKQHQATSKHISEMRKQGNVMRSRDLTGGLIFLVGIVLLTVMSPHIIDNIKNNFIWSFGSFKEVARDQDYILVIVKNIFSKSFYQLLPIFIILFVCTLLSPFLFGGWNFTLDVIQFKLTKLNPINNLSKLFSPKQALIEILKSMIKSTFILLVLIFYFIAKKDDIINLINSPVIPAIYSSTITINSYIKIISSALIFVVLFDVVYHYYRYQEQSKMSLQEIKDENKDQDGNPQIKRKIRLKQFALIKQRLTQTVPKANVIVTNPTHYSVALKYDSGKDHAPKVIAKGRDLIAYQIKQIGIAHAVTIYEAPELARAIYYTTNLGAPIHPGLYKAVAIVLSYVFQLKNYQMGKGAQPEFIANLEIPEELVYRE